MQKAVLLLVVLGLAALGLAACGGEEEFKGNLINDDDGLKVVLGDYYLAPERSVVPAGDIKMTGVNVGALEHEIVILQTDLRADMLPQDGALVAEDAIDGEVIDEIEPDDLPAGATASKTFNLDPGSYVLFCNVEGHYALGMFSEFTVR